MRRWLKDRSTPQGFQLLSSVTLFQLSVYTLITVVKWAKTLPVTLPRYLIFKTMQYYVILIFQLPID